MAFSGCATVRYEQCYPARRSICGCSGIANSGCEIFRYGSADIKELRFADAQESLFQAFSAHIWAVPNCKVVYADCQEWCFQVAKRSDMSSAIQQEGRIVEAQE